MIMRVAAEQEEERVLGRRGECSNRDTGSGSSRVNFGEQYVSELSTQLFIWWSWRGMFSSLLLGRGRGEGVASGGGGMNDHSKLEARQNSISWHILHGV